MTGSDAVTRQLLLMLFGRRMRVPLLVCATAFFSFCHLSLVLVALTIPGHGHILMLYR